MSKDYYETLGVPREATDDIISEAYRKLALQHHPDRNPDDEEAVTKFKEAAEAFEVLSNKEKRAHYDRFGTVGNASSFGGGGFRGFNPDIFRDFLGQRQPQERNANLRIDLELTFKEAAEGCVKDIKIKKRQVCGQCKGSGVKTWDICSTCGGRGAQVVQQGSFSIQMVCSVCHGKGKSPKEKCGSCQGGTTGMKAEPEKITVPGGVDDGMQLRLLGQGDNTSNGQGDLFVFIRVKSHSLFKREGPNIIANIPVSYSQLVCGDTLVIPTLSGETSYKLPAGTQSGTRLHMSGLGAVDINRPNRKGSLILEVTLDVPQELSSEYSGLIKKLQEYETKESTPKKKFFEATILELRGKQ